MKEKILSILFVCFLLFFFVLNIFTPDTKISKNERRKLEQFPNFSFSKVMNGKFMEDFDEYTIDQFILRDNFINKINYIQKFLTPNNKTYIGIVPDKNYYLNDNKYLNIDYDYLYERIKKINSNYIELRDILTLDDYYKTDTHWKQENLCKVVNRLGSYLDFSTNCKYNKKYYDNFYGVYLGQSALNIKPDKLTYLINDYILNSEVYYLENSKSNKVYIEENLNNLDSYDIYLDGASSYIEINNYKNNSGRELVIFRDSFASSLTPLLIEFYSKITLIDTRYISSNECLKLINFNNQDVLFLYSTLIVNNSSSLK